MKYGLYTLTCLFFLFTTSCRTIKMSPLYGEEKDTIQLPEVDINPSHLEYRGSATKYFDLINTELHVKPDFKLRSVKGTAILTVKVHASPQDTLKLDAKGLLLKSVGELKGDLIRPLQYTYDRSKLNIALGARYGYNETLKIEIEYTAYPYARLDSGVIKNREKLGLTFINPDGADSLSPTQIWSQGETEYNSAWFPTIEATNQKMRQEIFITVDSAYTTLSNGKLMSRVNNKDGTLTWDWKMEYPHAPYLAMMAVGNWTVIHDMWRTKVPVNYYVEPAFAPYARMIFGRTPEMMEFFSGILKYDYPWNKFSQVVVREYTSGAMENTTAVVHFDLLQHDRRAHIDNTYEDVISHELFHHWFGDLVTCESWDYLSMNESFATLGEFLWKEHKYGEEEAGAKRQDALGAYLREANYSKEAIVNHYYKDPEELFDRHRYEKGGLVLHMLRTYLGDDVFFRGLSEYLHERAYKTTELDYLRMKMEEVSGQDLQWFFHQWFELPGHPDLAITHRYRPATKTLTVYTHQLQKDNQTPLFKLPVDIDIYGANKTVRKRVILEHTADSFSFPLEEEPRLVNFDALKYLLCHKSEGKSMAEWMYQYYHAPLYLDRFEALESIAAGGEKLGKDSLIMIIRASLADKAWNIRKTAIELFFSKMDNYQGEFRDKIHALAIKDPKSQVRATAIATIDALEKSQGEAIYRLALKDSSYLVVGIALNSLLSEMNKSDSVEKILIAGNFENYTSAEVLRPVMALYGQYAGFDKLPFFHRLPYVIQRNNMNLVITAYKKMLMRGTAPIVAKEMPFILRLRNKLHSFWEVMAYQNLLTDLSTALKDNKIHRDSMSQSEVVELAARLDVSAGNIDLKRYGN
jgi:aminopeptidase N